MLFKLILGAGNNDEKEVKRLVEIYSSAGADIFDTSFEMSGVAKSACKNKNCKFCVSVTLKGDIHGKKAVFDGRFCVKCDKCIEVCPQKAITKSFFVEEKKCIGCGKCEKICPKKCFFFKDYNSTELDYKNLNCDIVELHCSIKADGGRKKILETFKKIAKSFKGKISVCLSRKYFSDTDLVELFEEMEKIAKGRLIIQADGNPMTGGSDDFSTTFAAVSIGKLFEKTLEKSEVELFISGGTNSKTVELAKFAKLKYNGVAMGSYARKIVEGYDKDEAILIAKKLVDACKKK